jgi:hypothetical protein
MHSAGCYIKNSVSLWNFIANIYTREKEVTLLHAHKSCSHKNTRDKRVKRSIVSDNA